MSNGLPGPVYWWAAWIAPLLALQAWSRCPDKRVFAVVLYAVYLYQYQGMREQLGALLPLFAVLSQLRLIPLMLTDHVLLASRARFPLLCSLAYPAAFVSVEYCQQLFIGTFTNLAYTQFDVPIVVQLASIGSVWIISFVVTWFGGVAHTLLTDVVPPPQLRRSMLPGRGLAMHWQLLPSLMFAGALASVFVYGRGRLHAARALGADPEMPFVAVGAVASDFSLKDLLGCVARFEEFGVSDGLRYGAAWLQGSPRSFLAQLSPEQASLACVREPAAARFDHLMEVTERAANAGAELIVWEELAAVWFADQEAEMLGRVAALARKHRVTVVVAALVVPHQFPDSWFDNMALVIAPDGSQSGRYTKHHITPGLPFLAGTGGLRMLRVPVGSGAGADSRAQPRSLLISAGPICYDGDSPRLNRVFGEKAQKLLAIHGSNALVEALIPDPAYDWAGISPRHTHMATFRAVENGVSLVRSTGRGTTAFVNQFGKWLASADTLAAGTPEYVVAEVPTAVVPTIYIQWQVGDLFAYTSIVLSFGLLFSFRKSEQHKHKKK